jgi:quercetin dioxygenase-like cupin family protein
MSKGIQKGETFKANEAIVYADGGVVSKELIHNDSGSITLFSFDEGQGLSEHFAPFDALLQVIDGEMVLTVDGSAHTIKTGECFIIPSGARHSVTAHKPFKMLITMIRGTANDSVRFTKH